MEKRSQTSIFEYSDYRQYLSDYYAQKKANTRGYSHRVFAEKAGLSSPSHLLMIIKGERNLSLKTIPKFADGLKLTAKERKYFELLVNYAQSPNLQDKAKFFGEIMNAKAQLAGLHKLEKDKFNFLSKWYVVAIYVLVDLKEFRPDAAWISKRFGGKVSVAQAEETLETLRSLKMIEQDPVKGYRQVSGAITVEDDTKSMAVFNYHQSMLRLATEALRLKAVNEREFNGATLSIPRSKLPELKEKIRAFRKELNQLASSFEDADEVYQLNIQLFPLTGEENS